jgi:CHRD domain
MGTLRNLVLFTFALLLVLAPRPVAARALLTFGAGLNNFAEVPANLSNGSGTLVLALNADGSVTYALTYSGLSSSATVAHIHIAQPGVNGGVVASVRGRRHLSGLRRNGYGLTCGFGRESSPGQ